MSTFQQLYCSINVLLCHDSITSFPRLLWKLLLPLVILCVVLITVLVLLVLAVRLWLQSRRNARRARDGCPTVAFFHPYCNAGGGGERVLWCAIRALQNRYFYIIFNKEKKQRGD